TKRTKSGTCSCSCPTRPWNSGLEFMTRQRHRRGMPRNGAFFPAAEPLFHSFSISNINRDTFKSVASPVQRMRRMPQEGHNYEKHRPNGGAGSVARHSEELNGRDYGGAGCDELRHDIVTLPGAWL